MFKKITCMAAVIVSIIMVSVLSCSKQSHNTQSKEIGIVFTSLNNPVFAFMKERMEMKAKELGYTAIILDSQEKSEVERQNVENLISKKVAAICILPVNADAVINTVALANKAGIPVVGWNRVVETGDKAKYVTQVVTDNVTGAVEAGKLAVSLLNNIADPKVVILRGVTGIDADWQRTDGFKAGIKGSKLEKAIVAEQPADFERQKGFTVMENIIQANKTINLVYAVNDEMALGAMQALKAANMNNVMIIGYDGAEGCVTEIVSGNITATVAQFFATLGTKAVDYAVKAAEGKAQGIKPVISVGTEIVDKNNAKGYVFK